MRTLPRLACTAAALGAALIFSGCTTPTTAKAGRPAHYYDMKVVESSNGMLPSPEELAQLREPLIDFVQTKGQLRDGAYYVRVNFNPVSPDQPAEWLVMKITDEEVSRYDLLASDAGDGPYYYPLADGYGYPFGGRYGYSAFGDYYYDPFDYYNGGAYFPPAPRHPRDHRTDDNDQHRPDDNDQHHTDGRHTVARHDGDDNHSPRSNGGWHPSDPGRWRGDSGSKSSYTPPASSGSGSTYSAPSYSPPAPSAASSPEPSSSRGGDTAGRNTDPQAAK